MGSTIVAVLVLSSVLFMAMPLGIIGSCFNNVWVDRDRILLMQRTRDRLRQWGFNAADIPELFKLVDRDGDGGIALQEFQRLIRHMRIGLSEERIVQLFETFDSDDSGTIDLYEFVRCLFPR